jgi:hypothetical protein
MAIDEMSSDSVGFTKAQCLSSWVSGSFWLAMILDPPALELLSVLRRLPDPGLLVEPDRLLSPVYVLDIVVIGCLLFE